MFVQKETWIGSEGGREEEREGGRGREGEREVEKEGEEAGREEGVWVSEVCLPCSL